eukprot:7791657-Pyramimonas_sp.AAC.1
MIKNGTTNSENKHNVSKTQHHTNSPIRACLCWGPSGCMCLNEVCHRFPRPAGVPRCPSAQVPGCPGTV